MKGNNPQSLLAASYTQEQCKMDHSTRCKRTNYKTFRENARNEPLWFWDQKKVLGGT